jgi:glycosyltransferase involved in cell wall biosynthesis
MVFAALPPTLALRESRRTWVVERFDWRDIARRTLAVYRAAVE